jgi:hypothetical protein
MLNIYNRVLILKPAPVIESVRSLSTFAVHRVNLFISVGGRWCRIISDAVLLLSCTVAEMNRCAFVKLAF